jgi:putative transposase
MKITKEHQLPITRQCQILVISRSNAYYRPMGISDEDRRLMRLLDELHLNHPFMGSRRLRDALWDEHGEKVNRKKVQRLMQLMGIQALYPKKRTSDPNNAHKVYPYLLRELVINRSNQVWCADISYLPMAKGFAYLVAIMDWHSRKVLSWRLSNTMDVNFCKEALEEAINRYGTPEIFNTDQGSQFTSEVFTDELKANNIRISMDGKGRWMDNVFIERLWRSVKYEEVYLKAYEDMNEARRSLQRYFEFYNRKRRHQTLACTPDQRYYADLPTLEKAG